MPTGRRIQPRRGLWGRLAGLEAGSRGARWARRSGNGAEVLGAREARTDSTLAAGRVFDVWRGLEVPGEDARQGGKPSRMTAENNPCQRVEY